VSADAAPVRRPRWYLLYFALAAFDVLAVCIGLALNQHVVALYAEAVRANTQWSVRLERLADLDRLAADVNAPGNDVFDAADRPGIVELQRAQVVGARDRFEAGIAAFRADMDSSTGATRAAVLADLDGMQRSVGAMAGITADLLDDFAVGRRDLAGREMAMMDRMYARTRAFSESARRHVRVAQASLLQRQRARAAELERGEWALGTMALLMVIGAALYGRRLARQASTARDELEREVAARTADLAEANAALHVQLAEREQLETALRHAQKMEAVGRLAGGIAHDFNNLLTTVLAGSGLVLDELPADDPMRQEVEEIRQAGERAAAVTRKLLLFSRRAEVEPSTLDLNAIVSDAGAMLRRLLGEDIALEVALAEGAAWVRADASGLEQVLVNLAVNARDAMPRGGPLRIATGSTHVDAAAVRRHPALRQGAYVTLEVADAGQGIAPELLPRIFEPFFTTKKSGEGTGLGLAIVYGIVTQYDGAVLVDSAPGRGSRFTVFLPAARAPEEVRAGGPEAAAVAAPHGHETILVAEDEPSIRRLTERVLARGGYRVLSAPTGAEAVGLAASTAEPIHLLIADVVMPDLGGPEAAATIARTRPGLKVLMMSGYADVKLFEHGIRQPGYALLRKPFTPAALLEQVRAVLDGRA
jgi:signal transduction histidine kinase